MFPFRKSVKEIVNIDTDIPTTPAGTSPLPDDGESMVTSISQIFHPLVYLAEAISEALTGIFDKAAEKETRHKPYSIVLFW